MYVCILQQEPLSSENTPLGWLRLLAVDEEHRLRQLSLARYPGSDEAGILERVLVVKASYLSFLPQRVIRITVSTCLERSKKTPFKPSGTLTAGYNTFDAAERVCRFQVIGYNQSLPLHSE